MSQSRSGSPTSGLPAGNSTPGGGAAVNPTDLGIAAFTSPLARRRRDSRWTTLTGEAINAICLNNEIQGEDGNQILLPDNPAARNLFGRGTTLQVQPPVTTTTTTVMPGCTITIDGHVMTLSDAPSDKDKFITPRLWDKTT